MDPHAVLGVARSATPEEIKSAYRKLAKEHHPDRHGGSEDAKARFQEIQNAYDALRADKPRPQAEQQQRDFHSTNAHDMFEEMMRRHFHGAGFSHESRHTVMHAYLEVTLEQAFTGCQSDFRLPHGMGVETVKVDIPAGVQHNEALVHQINENGVNVTLQIVIRMRQHQNFARQGDDLLCRLDVEFLDAILGCRTTATTLTGEEIEVEVPPNSGPHTVIRVAGHGMPVRGNPSQRGDLHVHLGVLFREFTEEERAVLAQLRK